LKLLIFLFFVAAQAALVIFVQAQTGDQVGTISVAVACVFFLVIVAFAVDLV